MNKKTPLLLLGLILLSLMAFSEMSQNSSEPVFYENFSRTFNENILKRDYQVWENGAVLNVFLEKDIYHSGGKSLGVKIISPNPNNDSINGSIYRSLDIFEGNWGSSSGIRFWISQPNDSPLLLSFNVKERFREYWAVAESGVFYFEEPSGIFHQEEIYYNNLIIPPNFEGFVILPFSSLSVPEWNTAISNNTLDLARIESFAFSIIVGEDTPQTFYIDNIEVFGETTFSTLAIDGTDLIEIPASGERLEFFTASLGDLETESTNEVDVLWSIEPPHDPSISINQQGVLRVPTGSSYGRVVLRAMLQKSDYQLVNTIELLLVSDNDMGDQNAALSESVIDIQVLNSEGSSFESRFSAWTTKNRALFVLIVISIVTIFLFGLASIQTKLK